MRDTVFLGSHRGMPAYTHEVGMTFGPPIWRTTWLCYAETSMRPESQTFAGRQGWMGCPNAGWFSFTCPDSQCRSVTACRRHFTLVRFYVTFLVTVLTEIYLLKTPVIQMSEVAMLFVACPADSRVSSGY